MSSFEAPFDCLLFRRKFSDTDMSAPSRRHCLVSMTTDTVRMRAPAYSDHGSVRSERLDWTHGRRVILQVHKHIQNSRLKCFYKDSGVPRRGRQPIIYDTFFCMEVKN